MPDITILFVDNNADFLDTRSEFLEREGYKVLKAYTLEQAHQLLEEPNISLAILDIRIMDDDDEQDTSGIKLARQMPKFIPKIILTGFPTYETVQKMSRVSPGGMSVAVDIIAKAEGPERLLMSVNNIVNILETVQFHAINRKTAAKPENNNIFVVHGHDDAARHSVARFIEKLGLNAIILCEQNGGSRTIMEQLDKYSDVSFAVVLLTPDDVGCAKDKNPRKLLYRARQNVIFELGFFIGRLTRERVVSLYTEDVEILSDYHGVLYIQMDANGGWKGKLVKEFEEAGFQIDPQKLKNAI
jgi:predicted nucleotide-binding protein